MPMRTTSVVCRAQSRKIGTEYQPAILPLGLSACLGYHLDSLDSVQQCTIKASTIGSFTIAAAQVSGSATPPIQIIMPCPKAATSASVPSFEEAPKSKASNAAGSHLLFDGEISSRLFRQLESQLVLPVLRVCYKDAGQALPASLSGGLAGLPAELLMRILSHLDVRPTSIASQSSTGPVQYLE